MSGESLYGLKVRRPGPSLWIMAAASETSSRLTSKAARLAGPATLPIFRQFDPANGVCRDPSRYVCRRLGVPVGQPNRVSNAIPYPSLCMQAAPSGTQTSGTARLVASHTTSFITANLGQMQRQQQHCRARHVRDQLRRPAQSSGLPFLSASHRRQARSAGGAPTICWARTPWADQPQAGRDVDSPGRPGWTRTRVTMARQRVLAAARLTSERTALPSDAGAKGFMLWRSSQLRQAGQAGQVVAKVHNPLNRAADRQDLAAPKPRPRPAVPAADCWRERGRTCRRT